MLKNEIKKSWEKNATEWIRMIENEMITSRKYTNPAILEAIIKHAPTNILDVGCGEGWLIRELSKLGISGTGIDAANPLIENARKKGNQDYFNISYEEIIDDKMIPGTPFDAIIFNFSLFLKDETESLLASLHHHLSHDGCIIIQSLHPVFLIKNSLPYKSQWIEDSWAGLKGNFINPHHWFLRTFSDWLKIFSSANLVLKNIMEPTNEEFQPISIIFQLKPQN